MASCCSYVNRLFGLLAGARESSRPLGLLVCSPARLPASLPARLLLPAHGWPTEWNPAGSGCHLIPGKKTRIESKLDIQPLSLSERKMKKTKMVNGSINGEEEPL
jgi:hypothetical protein